MPTVDVLLLSAADQAIIHACNANHPRGPMMIICDLGSGPSILWDDIHLPLYQEWYDALDAELAFTSRSATSETYSDGP